MTALLPLLPLLAAALVIAFGGYWLARWEEHVRYGPLVDAAQKLVTDRRDDAGVEALAAALEAVTGGDRRHA
jgi:hypothetical protein